MPITRNKNVLTYYLLVFLFLLAGTISWRLYFKTYRPTDTVDVHLFPARVGDWSATELPISERDYEILETRNAFTRKYTNSKGEAVYLFVVYSQDNRKVSHPPEICYTGIGAAILNKTQVLIDLPGDGGRSFRVNKLALEHGHTMQIMYYWYKVGDIFLSNYWFQQMLFSFRGVKGNPSSSALIRLSAIAANPSEGGSLASERIEEFMAVIIPFLKTYLP